MGEVYLARDTILNREVAIKFLPEAMQKDDKARERFLREAKSAAALDHPFICKIYETGEIDGKAFIVMEYVEGQNLREKLEEEPLSLRDSLRVGLEIAAALETAHEKGIVHRDLKPENIMLTPQGYVKVMDFGLAKRLLPDGEDSLTKTLTKASITEQGAIIGTLSYMSPEQAKGDIIDWRSDIFSLGVLLYEMISGKRPFSRPSHAETLSAILRDAPPAISIKPRKMSPAIDRILRKSLAKNPMERYQSVLDLAVDIRKVQRETALGSRFLFRGLPAVVGSILIIALLLTGVWWISRQGRISAPEMAPEPKSVLVADFQNQTGDPVFDGALEQFLIIGLEDASFIDIYKRENARKLVDQIDPSAKGRLDAELAQLVSVREKINVVVSGLIDQSDEGYTIKVLALDPFSSKKITEASKTFNTKADWYKAVGSLAAHMRSKLGGIPPDSAQALSEETFTTTSLEAMNAYARAQKLIKVGKHEEAIKQYKHAIKEDQNFGRAYSGLALIYYNRGQHQKAEEYFQKAMAQIDRMSEREKYRTRGIYNLVNRNCQKAIEEYSSLVEKFPADSAGHTNLALAYFWAHDFERAVEVGRHAVELQPKSIMPRYNLAWSAIAIGDFELAEQEAREVLKLSPEFDEVYVCLALLELAQGRSTQAEEIYQQLMTLSPLAESLAAKGLADFALYEGRLNDAKDILERGIALDLEEGRSEHAAYKRVILAHTLLLQGEKTLALEAADLAVAASKELGLLFSVTQTYLQAGWEDKAHELAAKLSEQLQPEPLAYAKLIEGEIKMARGELPEAIKLFHEAKDQLDTWLGRFALGRAYLKAEDFAAAHSEFEWCLMHHGEATSVFFDDVPSYRYFPPVYYYLGRAQEGLGSTAASESYQKFLKIKEKADQDIPLVEDARRRLSSH